MISVAGKQQVIVCDQCAHPCTNEVIERNVWRVGSEDQVESVHFCSRTCEDEFTKVPERISQGIERGTRLEVGKIYRHQVCPRCESRLRKIFEVEDTML